MPSRSTTRLGSSGARDATSGPERVTMPLRERRITTSWDAPLAAARDATLELQATLMEQLGQGSETFERGQTLSVNLKLYSPADDPRDPSTAPYAVLNAAPFFVGASKKNPLSKVVGRRHAGVIAPAQEYPHRQVTEQIRYEHFALVIPDFSSVEPAALCAHFRDRNRRPDTQDIIFVLENGTLGPAPYHETGGYLVSFEEAGSALKQEDEREGAGQVPQPQFVGVKRVVVPEAHARLRQTLPPFDPGKIAQVRKLLTDRRMEDADEVMTRYGLDLGTLVGEGILPFPYGRLIDAFKRRIKRRVPEANTDSSDRKIPDPWVPPSVVTLYIRTLRMDSMDS